MPTHEQIEQARETCRAIPSGALRRRRHAITAEYLLMLRRGENSDAAERRLEMLEAASKVINDELRARFEKKQEAV